METRIFTALVILIIIQFGINLHLYREIGRLEDSIERIKLYLHTCADDSPSAIQKCAEAMKRMGEAIGKIGIKNID